VATELGIGILVQRRIEAAFAKGIFAEHAAELGEERATALLARAINKLAEQAGDDHARPHPTLATADDPGQHAEQPKAERRLQLQPAHSAARALGASGSTASIRAVVGSWSRAGLSMRPRAARQRCMSWLRSLGFPRSGFVRSKPKRSKPCVLNSVLELIA
jgi:hypothetical protein